jgi:NADH-quinone oxidoreductase subunit J
MPIEQIIFYIFSAALIFSALFVIVAKNPVHSALFLVLAFFASSGLWILLNAEFLAFILILVYVGAVMTLFLFVVMMLNLDVAPKYASFVKYVPLGILVLALMVAAVIYVILPNHFSLPATSVASTSDISNITRLGMVLYTDYVYPFELAAILLLIAIIAAISLSLRKPRSKVQNVTQQLQTTPQQRIRLVDMPTDNRKGTSND